VSEANEEQWRAELAAQARFDGMQWQDDAEDMHRRRMEASESYRELWEGIAAYVRSGESPQVREYRRQFPNGIRNAKDNARATEILWADPSMRQAFILSLRIGQKVDNELLGIPGGLLSTAGASGRSI
jgi:hypothetical protein